MISATGCRIATGSTPQAPAKSPPIDQAESLVAVLRNSVSHGSLLSTKAKACGLENAYLEGIYLIAAMATRTDGMIITRML